MTTIRTYLDFMLAFIGAIAVLSAVTILIGWPYALLGMGVFLIVIAVVMPPWA